MLVLTRKLGEMIQVGDDVRLTVLKIKGNTVRIGIEAPANVRVKRGELPEKPVQTEITLVMETEVEEVGNQTLPLRPRHAAWRSRVGQEMKPADRPSNGSTGHVNPRETERAEREMNRLREIVDRVTHTPLKTLARVIGVN